MRATAVALATPAPSVVGLLRRAAPASAAIAELVPQIELVRTLPCLTVIARYPEGTAPPAWEASYPDQGGPIQSIFHDSSKREGARRLILVVQATPRFSREHLEAPAEA